MIFTTFLLLLSAQASNSIEQVKLPPAFTAVYEIRRNDKLKAKQTTEWQKFNSQEYRLKDQLQGTHGLASWSGFKRTEQSTLQVIDNSWQTTAHNMQQKLLLKKWNYQFNRQKTTIAGQHKDKEFTLHSEAPLFSTHALPIYAGALACQGQTEFELKILKSDRLQTYRFIAKTISPKHIVLSRKYPAGSKKKSQSWLNRQQNCLTEKILFDNGKGTIVETRLTEYKPLPTSPKTKPTNNHHVTD